jgi:hypothetical protein|tara:strand:- start:1132 stop:1392 length:261 start_codon:yes stop_codon:yes gene_type:complete
MNKETLIPIILFVLNIPLFLFIGMKMFGFSMLAVQWVAGPSMAKSYGHGSSKREAFVCRDASLTRSGSRRSRELAPGWQTKGTDIH